MSEPLMISCKTPSPALHSNIFVFIDQPVAKQPAVDCLIKYRGNYFGPFVKAIIVILPL